MTKSTIFTEHPCVTIQIVQDLYGRYDTSFVNRGLSRYRMDAIALLSCVAIGKYRFEWRVGFVFVAWEM